MNGILSVFFFNVWSYTVYTAVSSPHCLQESLSILILEFSSYDTSCDTDDTHHRGQELSFDK